MRKKITSSIILIFVTMACFSQWKLSDLNGSSIRMLKQVNGSLFAYAINNTSSVGGLYRSFNHGASWQLVDSTDFKFIYISDMDYDSVHSVYAVVTSAQKGIFTSTDGNTWTQGQTLWGGDGIAYINGKFVITLPASGVGISTNGGTAWNVSSNGLPGPFYVHYVTRIGDSLFLSNQGSPVYVSANQGASWVAHSDSLTYFANCYFKHDGLVYSGLYLNGVSRYAGYWSHFSTNLPSSRNINALTDAGDSLFCGGDSIGVWMNVTGSWQNFSCGLPTSSSVYKLVNDSGFLYAATDKGIWKMNLKTGCTSIGIASVANTNTIEIYPTITHDRVNIYSAMDLETIQVINIAGQVVESGKNQRSIDVRAYSPGIYFVRITLVSGDCVVKKFVVD